MTVKGRPGLLEEYNYLDVGGESVGAMYRFALRRRVGGRIDVFCGGVSASNPFSVHAPNNWGIA